MKNLRKILITFLIITGLFWAFEALAVGWLPLVPCGREGTSDCQLCHFWQLGSNIINFLIFGLAVPGAILLFLWAGLLFLTSAGNEKRIESAKNVFRNTVLGLVIVFVSWLVVETLLKTLANPTSEAGRVIMAWNKFPACQ